MARVREMARSSCETYTKLKAPEWNERFPDWKLL